MSKQGEIEEIYDKRGRHIGSRIISKESKKALTSLSLSIPNAEQKRVDTIRRSMLAHIGTDKAPLCSVCNTKVDVDATFDNATDSILLIYKCHGSAEAVSIPYYTYEMAGNVIMDAGYKPFKAGDIILANPNRLAVQPKQLPLEKTIAPMSLVPTKVKRAIVTEGDV